MSDLYRNTSKDAAGRQLREIETPAGWAPAELCSCPAGGRHTHQWEITCPRCGMNVVVPDAHPRWLIPHQAVFVEGDHCQLAPAQLVQPVLRVALRYGGYG